MRIRIALIVLALAGVVALLATDVTGAATDSGNRAAARRDAVAHLRALNLPSGAARVPAPRHVSLLEASFANIRRDAAYRIPGATFEQVIAYVRAHPPAGSRLAGTGATGSTTGGLTEESLQFAWPAVRDVLGSRELQVSATAAAGGAARVLAVAQSDWIVQRPRRDFVPRGIREVDVTVTSSHGNSSSGHGVDVVNRTQIRRLVRMVNRMARAQPGAFNCPGFAYPARAITMTFREAVGGPVVAVLTYVDFRPYGAPSYACNPVQLTVRGHRGPPLIGGTFVRRAEGILSTKL